MPRRSGSCRRYRPSVLPIPLAHGHELADQRGWDVEGVAVEHLLAGDVLEEDELELVQGGVFLDEDVVLVEADGMQGARSAIGLGGELAGLVEERGFLPLGGWRHPEGWAPLADFALPVERHQMPA